MNQSIAFRLPAHLPHDHKPEHDSALTRKWQPTQIRFSEYFVSSTQSHITSTHGHGVVIIVITYRLRLGLQVVS